MTTGGALTSKKVTSQKGAGVAEVDEAEPEEPEDTEVVELADSEPVEKKSSGALANRAADEPLRRLSLHEPSLDVRGVDRIADEVVAAGEPIETTVQGAAAAVEHVAFETLSAITTFHDAGPVLMAAPEAPIAQPTFPRLLTNLVSALGLGALASDTPGLPSGHRSPGAARIGSAP